MKIQNGNYLRLFLFSDESDLIQQSSSRDKGKTEKAFFKDSSPEFSVINVEIEEPDDTLFNRCAMFVSITATGMASG